MPKKKPQRKAAKQLELFPKEQTIRTALRCDACRYKTDATKGFMPGNRCPNPFINNGCDGTLRADLRPSEPGYIVRG
jgi:hypothetical protein